MAVRPESLDTPERGMILEDRGPAAAGGPAESEDPVEAELRTLRERIDQARNVEPGTKILHCRDCFHRGRDAALRLIEGR